ncbi:hypothetical protein LSAT2_007130 [Lamellibrachia satsuma]|nr:hypothetical protein LSAT2_007130 [Lamellibrachia satsuma]
MEAGYGKHPCDRIGEAITKMIKTAVKKDAILSDTDSIYNYVVIAETKMKFVRVSPSCDIINSWNITPVTGLTTTHAIQLQHGVPTNLSGLDSNKHKNHLMPVSQIRAKIVLFAKIPEVVINALAKMITLEETVKHLMPVSQVRAKMGLFAKIPGVVIDALAKMITLEETVKHSMPVSQVRAKIGLFAKIPEVVIDAIA